MRHKGSFLGILWTVIQPILMMIIYTVVFGLIFKGGYKGIEDQSTLDYALGIFLSLSIYHLIAEIVGMSPSTILSQPNLVKKVVFPLEILPVTNLAVALHQFGISLILTLIGVLTIGQGLSLQALLFLVALAPLIPLALGIAFLFSALGVFLRDLQQVAGPFSLVLMYASAVFYSAQMVPAPIWVFLKYNPLLHIIEQARATLLWHQPMDWFWLAYSFAFGFAVLGFGLFSFKKLKPAFADVL